MIIDLDLDLDLNVSKNLLECDKCKVDLLKEQFFYSYSPNDIHLCHRCFEELKTREQINKWKNLKSVTAI